MEDLAKRATAPGPSCSVETAVQAARMARRLRAVGSCFEEWAVATPEQKLSDMGVLRDLEQKADALLRDWEAGTGKRTER